MSTPAAPASSSGCSTKVSCLPKASPSRWTCSGGVSASGPLSRCTAPWRPGSVSVATATAAMSAGSTIATGTSANGARTRSPSASWSRHRSRFDWNEHGRRNVCVSPDATTARSESRCIRASGLSPTPSPAELADSRTTWASGREARRPGSAAYPLITKARSAPWAASSREPGCIGSATTPVTPPGHCCSCRLAARTSSPRSRRPRTTPAPTFPVAPITSTATLLSLGAQRGQLLACRWSIAPQRGHRLARRWSSPPHESFQGKFGIPCGTRAFGRPNVGGRV